MFVRHILDIAIDPFATIDAMLKEEAKQGQSIVIEQSQSIEVDSDFEDSTMDDAASNPIN